MNEFGFLTEEQHGDIYRNYNTPKKIEIFKKRGLGAPITDFSILLGGYVNDKEYYKVPYVLENRLGFYWTSSDFGEDGVWAIRPEGCSDYITTSSRFIGARPNLPYSSIRNIASDMVKSEDGIIEVKYGEYPQKVASKKLQKELEKAYKHNRSIRKTGKIYTVDSRKYDEDSEKFSAQIIEEYLFDDGKKYIRVKANSFFDDSGFKLSNGENYKNGDYVWVEVQPISWLIDEKNDIALSEKILFAGVQFKHEKNYKGDFKTTDIKKFMDKYFSKDIIPSLSLEKRSDEKNQTEINKDVKNTLDKYKVYVNGYAVGCKQGAIDGSVFAPKNPVITGNELYVKGYIAGYNEVYDEVKAIYEERIGTYVDKVSEKNYSEDIQPKHGKIL